MGAGCARVGLSGSSLRETEVGLSGGGCARARSSRFGLRRAMHAPHSAALGRHRLRAATVRMQRDSMRPPTGTASGSGQSHARMGTTISWREANEREAAAAAEAEQHGGGALATAIGEEAIDCSAAAERNTAARHCDGTAGGLQVGLTGCVRCAACARSAIRNAASASSCQGGPTAHGVLWVLTSHTLGTHIAHAGYSGYSHSPGTLAHLRREPIPPR